MKFSRLAIVVATCSLAACGGSDKSSTSDILDLENVRKVLTTNADIAYAAYSDSVVAAQALKSALSTFRADPSEINLQAAKRAWLVAREPYGQTEVYRFRNSPIDSTDYGSANGPQDAINAWPLGEALIDYVQVNDTDFGDSQIGVTGNGVGINGGGAVDSDNYNATMPKTNIIGDTSIEINADLLENSATAEDEHDVISGYHAIEFLLWGQDLNDDAETTDGTDRQEAIKVLDAEDATEDDSFYDKGGDRPIEDFQPSYDAGTAESDDDVDAAYDSSIESHRRHKFLEVAVDKLIADLESVRDGWADGADYRTAFTTVDTKEQALTRLTEIFTGMGTLSEGELAGERMQIAFTANSQEDEHSCFSDNTHRDIWLNAEGISNSYFGSYAGYDSTLDGLDDETANAVDGYGIDDWLKDSGEGELAVRLTVALSATEEQYTEIDTLARSGQPFDVQIMAANAELDSPIAQTILALNAQAAIISEIAEAVGINEVVVDPDVSACDTADPTARCDQ
ncbi:MAG: imelysin family protein [Pseudomonadota bacterium]|nr:imelysin family protein [Pseudomonadota bacterium]